MADCIKQAAVEKAKSSSTSAATIKKRRKNQELKPLSVPQNSLISDSAPPDDTLDDQSDFDLSGEEEDSEDYCKGGYHPVEIGETYNNNRYIVRQKLGWGHFSTVWLAWDTKLSRHVALKVVRSASHYTETAVDEIKLLQKIASANMDHPGRHHVVSILDEFKHHGPNGVHICMVFEVLGENLLSLIKRHKHKGIPVPLVKQIVKQVLLGLDYLHRECGIIHTDLKPENVLICIDNVEKVASSVVGRGNNSASNKYTPIKGSQPLPSPATTQFSVDEDRPSRRSSVEEMHDLAENEVIEKSAEIIQQDLSAISLHKAVSNSPARKSSMDDFENHLINVKIADLGNACWTHHHFTNDIQTRQYRSLEVILGAKWGASTDIWSMACMTFELLTGEYLFDPLAGLRYSKDDDHLAQIIELVGRIPKHLALSGSYSHEMFNRRGDLRNIHKLKHWGITEVLVEKYEYTHSEACLLTSFLMPMLELNPAKRVQAGVIVSHEWLANTKDMDGKTLDVEKLKEIEAIF